MHLGSHPDIVERIWKGIGPNLDSDCRLIVCGTPALVQPDTGIILAFASVLSIVCISPLFWSEQLWRLVLKQTKWSNGSVMDVAQKFGEGWIFGTWLKDEIEWCQQAYRVFGSSLR